MGRVRLYMYCRRQNRDNLILEKFSYLKHPPVFRQRQSFEYVEIIIRHSKTRGIQTKKYLETKHNIHCVGVSLSMSH